jgi:cyclopropane-fatty-acyl-phospholipid synthase
MRASGIREIVETFFREADIGLDGRRPWDITVRDERFYPRVFHQHSLGLGESYVDGWWDCPRVDQLFEHIYRRDLQSRKHDWKRKLHYLRGRLFNMQRPGRAWQVGERHYDVGNDLYRAMLGPRMIYSSCVWSSAESLDQAEEAKLELICRKLGLEPGMRVLDIGCGWGGFARHAVEKYGVEVVGITISREQAELAQRLCGSLPIEIRLADYRDVSGRFDRIASIGMIGHAGHRNYRTLMQVASRSLAPDGLFFIHTMGANRSTTAAEPWIDKYIFPNGMAPSIAQMGAAIENLFVMEDWENISTDYHRTGMAWLANFERAWPTLRERYGEPFRRMWRYYLCCFSAAFSTRTLQTWDLVLSKPGGRGRHSAVRG